MPVQTLPDSPNLDHLKKQAKSLLRGYSDGEPAALALVAEFHPRATLRTLADAQLSIARSYGFASWPALRRHLDVVTEFGRWPAREPETPQSPSEQFLRLACLDYGNDPRGRAEQARTILDAHPDLPRTLIHVATAVGDLPAATALLAADGSQARARGGPFDWEPLCYLTYSRLVTGDAVAVARVLLDAGADVNVGYLWAGTYPFTALTGAFGGGERAEPPHPQHSALARLLLQRGADPNDGQALYNRMFLPDNDHLRLLFEFGLGTGDGGVWKRRMGPALATPAQALADQLGWAAAHGMTERIELLLAHGVDPNGAVHAFGLGGRSPYELALRSGNAAAAQALVDGGADASRADDVDAFLAACLQADRRLATALAAADPSLPERARRRERAALLLAATAGNAAAVPLLTGFGFDVNVRRRLTALHEAASQGDLATVQALVAAGADVTIHDTSFDATPLGWARHGEYADVVAYLEPLTPD